jgi:hypothetical protein
MALQRSAPWGVALAAVALALLPTPARADHGTPFLNDRLATYMAISHSHWGGAVPTCVANGVTVIPVHAVLYDDPDPEVAARADQPGCRLWVDRGNWRGMRPAEACMIVVHEWGHLLGLDHSHDPLDVMADFPAVPPPECAALGRRSPRARASARRAGSCAVRAKRARRALRLRRTWGRRPTRHSWACVRRGFA